MAFKSEYLAKVYEDVEKRNPGEKEFLQAVKEVFVSLEPVVEQNPNIEKWGIMERIAEPERFIQFRVAWVDDSGKVQVNRGYRVQFNSAIGPYKGGIRLHPSVNASIIKFLGFEQVFKNSLTSLPMGGGKGGCDFDPRGKSDLEIMRFCQSFMTELYRHIGPDTDVPAGDIGTGAREIGYMFGQYKRIRNEWTGTLTGKGLSYGGSLARTEATGFGLCYFTKEMLASKGESFEGKRVIISGSGNVGTYANKKTTQLGGKVVAQSDVSGYVVDENGIDYKIVEKIYQHRGLISEYIDYVPTAKFVEGPRNMWFDVPADVVLPCATQNEIDEEAAKAIIANGAMAVAEGANMPNTPEAIRVYKNAGILYAPGKASNAGGVATSGLEMTQNSERLSWTFDEVDSKLESIMKKIYKSCVDAAAEYGFGYDLEAGANIAGFKKVAEAMIAQGVAY
ncbi:MAG: NADP-specific glutamate dehydrogenase [Oscillospiraceae bacterium]|nr:NADP-specific glutamate dehydrogenase [Oscillospiraceae bacterium]